MVRLKKRNPVSQTGKPGNPWKETKKVIRCFLSFPVVK